MPDPLRNHLIELLDGKSAHLDFDAVVKTFPLKLAGKKLDGSPHTAWQLLEHMRIAQWDIVEFSRNPKHVSPKWPDGYWPPTDAPPDADAWRESVKSFHTDLRAMKALISDPAVDLLARIPHGEGPTPLREALLVADHNSYHLGQ